MSASPRARGRLDQAPRRRGDERGERRAAARASPPGWRAAVSCGARARGRPPPPFRDARAIAERAEQLRDELGLVRGEERRHRGFGGSSGPRASPSARRGRGSDERHQPEQRPQHASAGSADASSRAKRTRANSGKRRPAGTPCAPASRRARSLSPDAAARRGRRSPRASPRAPVTQQLVFPARAVKREVYLPEVETAETRGQTGRRDARRRPAVPAVASRPSSARAAAAPSASEGAAPEGTPDADRHPPSRPLRPFHPRRTSRAASAARSGRSPHSASSRARRRRRAGGSRLPAAAWPPPAGAARPRPRARRAQQRAGARRAVHVLVRAVLRSTHDARTIQRAGSAGNGAPSGRLERVSPRGATSPRERVEWFKTGTQCIRSPCVSREDNEGEGSRDACREGGGEVSVPPRFGRARRGKTTFSKIFELRRREKGALARCVLTVRCAHESAAPRWRAPRPWTSPWGSRRTRGRHLPPKVMQGREHVCEL